MRPVDQTTFGPTEGNCFSACIATLLELPIEAVPTFLHDWPVSLDRWLAARGLFLLCITWQPGGWRPPGPYILGGQSPRGPHAVIAEGDRIVHDPHPSRAGLVEREDLSLLVPLDLARWARVDAPHAQEVARGG